MSKYEDDEPTVPYERVGIVGWNTTDGTIVLDRRPREFRARLNEAASLMRIIVRMLGMVCLTLLGVRR